MKLDYRLTISTVLNISDDMTMVDVHGRVHDKILTRDLVRVILITGWFSFLLSWMFNIMYYRVHPTAVDFNPSRSRARLFIYILGRRVKLPGYRDDNDRSKNTIRALKTATTTASMPMDMVML